MTRAARHVGQRNGRQDPRSLTVPRPSAPSTCLVASTSVPAPMEGGRVIAEETSLAIRADFLRRRREPPAHGTGSVTSSTWWRRGRGGYVGHFSRLGAAQGVFVPFMAPTLANRGYSPQGIGLVFAIASAAVVFAAPVWGQVGDVILGPRRTLQGAVIAAALVSLFLGERVAPSFVGIAIAAQYLLQTSFLRCSTRWPCMSRRRAPQLRPPSAAAEFVVRDRGLHRGLHL